MPKLTRNAVRCLRCKEVVESKWVHDYRECKCGEVAVDGGLVEDRTIYKPQKEGDPLPYEDLREWEFTTASPQGASDYLP